MPGRAASVGFSVGFMASRPSSSGEPVAASADASDGVATEKKLAASLESKLPPDQDGEDDELELDEDDDEELVVYTAKEAAGALATIYGFIKPFLGNYKKLIAFVGLGVLVETLFNVIMPLSLKFLIDDALGEEDFEALIRILSVLAVAGIVTSIVAIWYERLDA
jgi:ATP-binding cassette subfamily B protein